jgi:8-oxo-dGTP pyrophosphatase MutT (NUDIX family)
MIVCIPHAKVGYRQAILKRKSPASKEDRAFLFAAAARSLSNTSRMQRKITHGGAVVFQFTSEGPRYLLVEASGTRGRWVFPKGRVEDGESGAIAALREVGEEAGVRARLIRRLAPVEQKKEGEWIRIAYFLMAYAGRTKPLERRRVCWLAFDQAIQALDLGKSRRVLRAAHRLISATLAEPRRDRLHRAAARLAGWVALARGSGPTKVRTRLFC